MTVIFFAPDFFHKHSGAGTSRPAFPAGSAIIPVMTSEKLLAGKAAVVTGGAGRRGIGFATVRMFARHGARCAVLDLASADPESAAQDVANEFGGTHIGIVCDVRDGDACRSAVDQAAEALGRLDILVNNAGTSQSLKTEQIGDAEFDAMIDIHLRACLKTSQAAVPHFRKAGGGAIVNLSSISAVRGGGIFGGPHYSAAKAGVIGLTRATARELAPENIRANAVAPSLVETDILAGRMDSARKAAVASEVPMGRVGTPDDVAGVLLFLASDLAAYVTGEVVNITGGAHIG